MISRRKLMKSSLLAFGALTLSRSPVVKAAAPGYGITGMIAPELEVDSWINEDGESGDFSLADHAQKWVFLKCFQSWCPGCHSHGLPAVKKISHALAGNPGVVFAGIQTVFEGHSINTFDKLRKIQLQYDLNMPMGQDTGGGNGRARTMVNYRTGGTPWMILISPERQVIYNDFSIDADKAIDFLQRETA